MKRQASTTLFLIPASKSPLTLVIRRGPSKWWHFMLWNRDSGEVTPGSWFNGVICPNRCDLSPKGDWMVILAYHAANTPKAWTALCKPPSVKAIAFWPQEAPKHGGGFFDGRCQIVWMNFPEGYSEPEIRDEQPFDFGFQEAENQFYGTFHERLERAGWKYEKKSPQSQLAWIKDAPRKVAQLRAVYTGTADGLDQDFARNEPLAITYFWRISPSHEWELLEGATWADVNNRGEICMAQDGRLVTFHPKNPGLHKVAFDLNGLKPKPSVSMRTLIMARAQ